MTLTTETLTMCNTLKREEKTYKQANKNVLFGIAHGSFVFVVLIVLFGHQWLVGVVDVVVVVAAMKTAG